MTALRLTACLLLQAVGSFRSVFPDLIYRVEIVVAEGELVAVRWTARGTHEGRFLDIERTGKTVVMPGMDLFQLRACAQKRG